MTAGPGLIGGLLVGVATAKAVALVHKLPLVAVNHLEAHALTVGLTEGLQPPYLLLLVSGGHTQLLVVRAVGRYRRLGTTIDDALGEAFDKTAKLLGLGFPGGPAVEQMARTGRADRFALPRPMLGRPEPHFSFAGLKTAVRHQAQALVPLGEQDVADLCAAFEAAVAASVADRVRRGIEIAEGELGPGPHHLVVAGGVAANMRLRAALVDVACRRRISTACAATSAVHATMPPWWPGREPSAWRAAGPTASTLRPAPAGRSIPTPSPRSAPASRGRRRNISTRHPGRRAATIRDLGGCLR